MPGFRVGCNFRLPAALLVALATLASAASARTVPREGAATAQLSRLLKRSKPTEESQQAYREKVFRERLTLLRRNDPVPLPPLAGEWDERAQPVRIRELGGGRIRVSRPGSWQPDRTYATLATTTTVRLTGENPCLIAGRFRTLRESGTLEMTRDGNWLRGSLDRFDDYGIGGGGALGKTGQTSIAWRRRQDLSMLTVLAWREAILIAPERAAAEQKAAEESARKRAVEDERKRREMEESLKKQEDDKAAESELLGEGEAPAAEAKIPDMPPLPPPPAPGGKTLAEGGPSAASTGPAQAIAGAGVSPETKAYLLTTVPKLAKHLADIERLKNQLPGMLFNPAAVAQLMQKELMPALKELRGIVDESPPPPGPLSELHEKLKEATGLQEEAMKAMQSGGGIPNPQLLQRMQSLGKQAGSKVKEYEAGLQAIGRAAGVPPELLKMP